MRQLLDFLLRIVCIAAVAVWLADQPGKAYISWHGYVIESSAAFFAIVVIFFAYVFFQLFRLWHLLRNGPTLWKMSRQVKNLQAGQDFLTQGLVAIAGGNAAEAGRLAIDARKKLGTTTATLLLQAQAAQLAHDHKTARALFRAMIEDPESAVLGYRGLIMEARRSSAWDEIERLSNEVSQLKPDMPWLDWMRFESAARRQAWVEASAALDRLGPTRLLEQETLCRHRAAILIATSQQNAASGQKAAALEIAEQAAWQTPEWLPALINLAERQAAGDHKRAARRTIEKAWRLQPHPLLASLLRSTERDPMDAYKDIEHLCRSTESDPLSHLVLAEAAVSADIWGEARRHLMTLVAHHQATQTAYRLLARLERRESGDDRAAAQWLSKASEAAPDPAWLCTTCSGSYPSWQASCRFCGSFATLEWRQPGTSHFVTETPAPLLQDWSE